MILRSYLFSTTLACVLAVLASDYNQQHHDAHGDSKNSCSEVVDLLQTTSPLQTLAINVHRNGEAASCGTAMVSNADIVQAILRRQEQDNCAYLDKFVLESVLSEVILERLTPPNACGSSKSDSATPDLAGFCDMGPYRTVEQPDVDLLDRLSTTGTLPCRWTTREGVRVESLSQLNATGTMDLYGIPAGRLFQFAPSKVGEVFEIPHCNCRLKVLSISPAVFELHDFLSQADSSEMLLSAYFQRSVVAFNEGNPDAINYRTSDTGQLTNSTFEATIKQRALRLLGIDEFRQHIAEGPQLLRYNTTAGYRPHYDYMADITGRRAFNFDSEGTGSNRYATILIYLNHVEQGGETLFNRAVETPDDIKVALIRELRESNSDLVQGSWEENMTAACRSGFAVKPIPNRAILFYNQHPDGSPDIASEHGSCPVLKGSKYAANLWVWSNDHPASPHALMRTFQAPKAVRAVFKNTGTNDEFRSAVLFYNNVRFRTLGFHDAPLEVDTYKGHRWHVKVNGQIRKSFVIDNDEKELLFEF